MHTTSVEISNKFAELKGQNIFPIILAIHVLKSEYWVEIELYAL